MRKRLIDLLCLWISLFFIACQSPSDPTPPREEAAGTGVPIAYYVEAEDESLGLGEAHFGDLDSMLLRREIRALVPYNQTYYYIDGSERRGIAYEALSLLERKLKRKFKNQAPTLNLIFIPVTRDQLIPALAEGYGDIAVGNLTITPERREEVDFSNPFISDAREVLVSSPESPELETLADLSGKTLYLRPSSSYFTHVQVLNDSLRSAGKRPIKIEEAEELLEDEDILQMLDAGLIPYTIVDLHKAAFWAEVLDNISVHEDITVHSGGQIAWAFRKDSPQLAREINAFVKNHKKGTLMGNILFNRYLKDTDRLQNLTTERAMAKFDATIAHFKEYGKKYDFDWLLLAAQGYQESRLNQDLISKAGAIGIMQVRKSTARDPNVNIPEIEKVEHNIHAGTKYMDFLRDRYYDHIYMDPFNRTIFTLASYNAGPRRIAQMRKRAIDNNLDPNVWFGNVELITAREIGREPIDYVGNIYKYYLSYKLAEKFLDQKDQRQSDTSVRSGG
ncbi:MAG TPA: lytic transglycosylase F [Saprospiraceae bacterium]|nr:lytic transglycosylase F [Saprospiraceae bacterium]